MRVPVALLGALLLTGCAGSQDGEIARAPTAFGAALAGGDAATACDALAPLTREELEAPCPQALPEVRLLRDGTVGPVTRFGRQASVVVRGPGGTSDTWFLTRSGARWLVVAAGCRPRGDGLPYACALEGA